MLKLIKSKIQIFLKKIIISLWWKFYLKENEFHPSLNILPTDKNKVAIKRQIAHYLDIGYSVFNLPEYLIEKF